MRSRLQSTPWEKPSERIKRRAAARTQRNAAAAAAEQSLLRTAREASNAIAAAVASLADAPHGSEARRTAERTATEFAGSIVALLAARGPLTLEGMRALTQIGMNELPGCRSLLDASEATSSAVDDARLAFQRRVNGFGRDTEAAALASARAGGTAIQRMVLDLPGFSVALDASTDPPVWRSNARVPDYARDVEGKAIDVRGASLPEHLDKLVALARDHRYTFTVAGKTYAWGDSSTAGFVERR